MFDSDAVEPIKAQREAVRFFDGLEVDGYRMPDGEFRVGLAGASRVLGYAPNWLSRALSQETGTSMKVLRSLGFTEEIKKVVAQSVKGAREAPTVSLRDFNRLIIYAVSKGKKAALALQLSLTEVALNDFFVDAFGEPPLSIEKKRDLFFKVYAASISPEEWMYQDKLEIVRLALAGDEPQYKNGHWNDSIIWDDGKFDTSEFLVPPSLEL